MSNSLWPHGLQHTRLPCPSPSPGGCLKLIPIESMMPSNHLILCCPLLLSSIFPSIRVFSNKWDFFFLTYLSQVLIKTRVIFAPKYSSLNSPGCMSWILVWLISIQDHFVQVILSNSERHTHWSDLCRSSAAATAAKSLQSCPTLCDPIDGSPPGSAVPGIL